VIFGKSCSLRRVWTWDCFCAGKEGMMGSEGTVLLRLPGREE